MSTCKQKQSWSLDSGMNAWRETWLFFNMNLHNSSDPVKLTWKFSPINKFIFQVDEIEVVMPNQHYFTIDMTKMGLVNKDEVSSVVDTGISLTKQTNNKNDKITDMYYLPRRFFSPWITPQATSQEQCAGNSGPSCKETKVLLIDFLTTSGSEKKQQPEKCFTS